MNIIVVCVLAVFFIALLIVAFNLNDQKARLRRENLELRGRILRGAYGK